MQIFSTALVVTSGCRPRCWLACSVWSPVGGDATRRRDSAAAPRADRARPVGAARAASDRAAPIPTRCRRRRGLPPERRALQVVDGQDRIVDADVARARGLTLVDLSDGWAPRIFADGVAADGAVLPNRYRTVFVGLANNKTDGDGQPLSPGEQNYLELYGIPPTLSVLRERFLADAGARLRSDLRRRQAAGGRLDRDLGRDVGAEGAGQVPRARAAAGGGAREGQRAQSGGAGRDGSALRQGS